MLSYVSLSDGSFTILVTCLTGSGFGLLERQREIGTDCAMATELEFAEQNSAAVATDLEFAELKFAAVALGLEFAAHLWSSWA